MGGVGGMADRKVWCRQAQHRRLPRYPLQVCPGIW